MSRSNHLFIAIQDLTRPGTREDQPDMSPQTNLNLFLTDRKSTNDSLKTFTAIMASRPATDKSYWMLDISPIDSVLTAKHLMQNLPVNINDNVLWYLSHTDDNTVTLWDVYRIHKSMSLNVLELGMWSKSKGLSIYQGPKWSRRKDLQVCC